jgi:hypothetical protein
LFFLDKGKPRYSPCLLGKFLLLAIAFRFLFAPKSREATHHDLVGRRGRFIGQMPLPFPSRTRLVA